MKAMTSTLALSVSRAISQPLANSLILMCRFGSKWVLFFQPRLASLRSAIWAFVLWAQAWDAAQCGLFCTQGFGVFWRSALSSMAFYWASRPHQREFEI